MKTLKVLPILLAACSLLAPLAASAQTPDADRVWTTVGSTGTLDEESEGKVFFDHAIVQKGHTFQVGQVNSRVRTDGTTVDETDSAFIRYNVTAVDGLYDQDSIGMKVRFLDAGKGARVIAQLIEVDLATGAEQKLLTFDSNAADVPLANGYQTWDVVACKARFDFLRNAYYIDATLTTSTVVAESAAGINAIQLYVEPCPKF